MLQLCACFVPIGGNDRAGCVPFCSKLSPGRNCCSPLVEDREMGQNEAGAARLLRDDFLFSNMRFHIRNIVAYVVEKAFDVAMG